MDSWGNQDEFFSVSSWKRDDEEALRWAAIDKLRTYKRMRTSLLKTGAGGDNVDMDDGESWEVDVRKLNAAERQEFINRNFKITEEDHAKFLNKLRERIDRVGIPLPTLEVRFLNLKVEAGCHVGSRALPTLLNTTKNHAESSLRLCGVKNAQKVKLAH